MKTSVLLSIVFSVVLTVHAKADSIEQFVRDHSSTAIIRAAEAAISNDSRPKAIIWLSPLEKLAPKRVYTDRVNIVIVVKESELEESGLYIVRTASSYFPVNDAKWMFSHVKDGVYIYARKRKA